MYGGRVREGEEKKYMYGGRERERKTIKCMGGE